MLVIICVGSFPCHLTALVLFFTHFSSLLSFLLPPLHSTPLLSSPLLFLLLLPYSSLLSTPLLSPPSTPLSTHTHTHSSTGFKRSHDQDRKEVYEGPQGEISVTGASNIPNTCPRALTDLFASKGPCPTTGHLPHSFQCVYQPTFLKDSKNFLVFENFFYTSSALRVASIAENDKEKEDASKDALSTSPIVEAEWPLLTNTKNILKASSDICMMDWQNAQTDYPKDSQPKDTTLKLCFSSSYAAVFLSTGLGIADDKVLTIQKEVEGSEIEWALGTYIRA